MKKLMQYPERMFYCHRALLLFAFITAWAVTVHAQKEPQYTQYMYNIGSFNPAYVGTTETPEITAGKYAN